MQWVWRKWAQISIQNYQNECECTVFHSSLCTSMPQNPFKMLTVVILSSFKMLAMHCIYDVKFSAFNINRIHYNPWIHFTNAFLLFFRKKKFDSFGSDVPSHSHLRTHPSIFPFTHTCVCLHAYTSSLECVELKPRIIIS